MKKALIWFIPLLLVGSVMAFGDPDDYDHNMGEMPFDPTLKGHGTLEPNNEPQVVHTALSSTKYCRLDEGECVIKLKYGKQKKIKYDGNRYYMRYLGHDRYLWMDSQYNWMQKERYTILNLNAETGSFTTNDGHTIYYEDISNERDHNKKVQYDRKKIILKVQST